MFRVLIAEVKGNADKVVESVVHAVHLAGSPRENLELAKTILRIVEELLRWLKPIAARIGVAIAIDIGFAAGREGLARLADSYYEIEEGLSTAWQEMHCPLDRLEKEGRYDRDCSAVWLLLRRCIEHLTDVIHEMRRVAARGRVRARPHG